MKKIFVICIFIFFNFGLFAQTSQETAASQQAAAINLEQARLLALTNSRSLAKHELAIQSSILDQRNQLYTMLPSVSASYRGSLNYLEDWDFVNPADTFSSAATFSITQIIFQGGRKFIERAITSISAESTRKDALAEYFNVLDSIDNAYYAVLEAEAALEAEEASLETAIISFSIAEIRHSTGIISPGDFLRALADKEARENAYNQARRNLTLSQTRLRTLTGLTNNPELEPIDFSAYEGVLVRLSAISDEEADVLYENFWNLLAASNPSLARAALNNERAQKSLSLTMTDFSPTISATVFSSGLTYSSANGFDTMPGTGGISITGTIPVDFWVIANRIKRSQIARDSAALDYISAESSLETELQTALLNTFAQAGSVLSSRRSLEYTERHYEYVMERYRLSQSSVSDLSDASSMLINSRNNHIKSTYSFLQSLSRLRSLCALDDEERLIELLS